MKTISIYQIEDSPIGFGYIGNVFRGTDLQGCQVAINEILTAFATDFAVRTKPRQNSDSIVKVYDQFPLGDKYKRVQIYGTK